MINSNKLQAVIAILVVYGLGLFSCVIGQQGVLWVTGQIEPEDTADIAGQANQYADWKAFSSEDGNFSILFPDTPRENLRMPANASLEETIHTLSTNVETISYEVSYNDYVETEQADLLEAQFNAVRDNLMTELSGQVVEETSNTFNGFPGRQIKFTIPDEASVGGKVGVMQLCLVENRLYQITVIGAANDYSRADVEQFLGSFTLLAQPNVEVLNN